jgi:hypothetical protein
MEVQSIIRRDVLAIRARDSWAARKWLPAPKGRVRGVDQKVANTYPPSRSLRIALLFPTPRPVFLLAAIALVSLAVHITLTRLAK